MAKINKTLIVTVAGFLMIFLAVGINGAMSTKQKKTPPPKAVVQLPVVSVSQVSPVSHQASVVSYGEVVSRHQLDLTAQVSGQITYLSPKFLSGHTFEKGEVIAKIEPIIYQQALASAQASLADAKLALAQEELNSRQAAQEWQQSGLANEQASDLVLRKPQLAAAQATLSMAKTDVEKAQYDLEQTQLVAPFNALVVTRQVQLGSNVQAGVTLAELYDTAVFEIALPLSQQQWQLLPENDINTLSALTIAIVDETNQHQWQAKIDRVEQHIDGTSRQRSLISTVEQPITLSKPLYPGTFVKATISGQSLDNLWKLPASALIDNQTVWQVTQENVLEHLAIAVVFSQGSDVYVQPEQPMSVATIVNRPLASYLAKMKVEAVVEERQ
ncbi:efflux RND transporter periplasmic adaptor subunit [Thalassotalea sp. PLHSN55]|uniref:efflux RND transporter periplasmic adaptor subunit n=1 Tax=Thalassotalea sp. PLHSN55 TaxID=3435888 RepID=UPI003F83A8A4